MSILTYSKKTMYGVVKENLDRFPDKPAYRFFSKSTTYTEFIKKVDNLAERFVEHGLKEGDSVIIITPNIPQGVDTIYAVNKLGAIIVPVFPLSSADEIAYYFDDTNAKFVVTIENFLPNVIKACGSAKNKPTVILANIADELPEVLLKQMQQNPPQKTELPSFVIPWEEFMTKNKDVEVKENFDCDIDAVVFYSGGTTGRSKGIVLSSFNLNALANQTERSNGLYPMCNIDCLSITPIFHGFGLGVNIHLLLFSGGTCILVPSMNAKELGGLVAREKPNFIAGVPMLFTAMMASPELQNADMSFVRGVYVGGDSVPQSLINEFNRFLKERNSKAVLREGYGLTENVTVCSINDANPNKNGSIGQAMIDNEFFVEDLETGKHLKPYEKGEICLAGPSLMKRYLNNEEATKNTIKMENGVRVLHTGDYGYMDEDGYMYFIQRLKRMIITSGFNVCPSEIERVVEDYPNVQKCCCIGKKDAVKGQIIKIFIQSVNPIEREDEFIDEIRDYCKEKLSNYAVPEEYEIIDKFPLTKVGKISVLELEKREEQREKETSNVSAEEALSIILKKVIGTDKINDIDEFFRIGGNSLNLITILNGLRKYGYDLKLEDFIKAKKMEDIIGAITKTQTSKADYSKKRYSAEDQEEIYAKYGKENVKTFFQALPIQAGMIYHSQYSETKNVYNSIFVLRSESKIDEKMFMDAGKLLYERYDMLKSNFYATDKNIFQVIVENKKPIIDVVKDVQDIKSFTNTIQEKGFDVENDCLYRLIMVECPESDYILFNVHHALEDSVSVICAIRTFYQIYSKLQKKEDIEVILEEIKKEKAKDPSYEEYANNYLEKDKEPAKEYYKKLLDGYEGGELSIIPQSTREKGNSNDSYTYFFNKDLENKVNEFCKKQGYTHSMLAKVVWSIVLQKYNFSEDVLFGEVVTLRDNIEYGNEFFFGNFINTVPIRLNVSPLKNSIELLNDVREQKIISSQYQFLSTAEIYKTFGSSNIIGSIVNVEEYDGIYYDAAPEMLRKVYMREDTNFPIEFCLFAGKNMNVSFCASALFSKKDIDLLAGRVIETFKQVIENPTKEIGKICILPKEEIEELNKFNDTYFEYDKNETVITRFEEQARKTPYATALDFYDRKLTYQELDAQSDYLANLLKQKGVKKGDVVGVFMKRSPEMIVALFGIIKCGGAYLPMDESYPKDRLSYVFEDSKAVAVVCDNDMHPDYDIMQIDGWQGKATDKKCGVTVTQDDYAYIIYTSGTTGKPKGVVTIHRGLDNLLWSYEKIYNLKESDNVLQVASYTFDQSVWDIFGILCKGGRLIIINKDDVHDPEMIARYCNRKHATIASFTPAMVAELDPSRFRTLRILDTSGEAASPSVLKRWIDKLTVVNTYGPTEYSVNSCSYIYKGEEDDNVPIGGPICNTRFFVLGKGDSLCGVGMNGELCIAGDGISAGYLNKPELTKEKFVPSVDGNGIMYRSGDLTRWMKNGAIEFFERIDSQIKIRGFRIELGEIDAVLRKQPSIKDCFVCVSIVAGAKAIVAYIITDGEIGRLKEEIKEFLPEYMVPQYFVKLDRIPRSLAGKVDRRSLPSPDVTTQSGAKENGKKIEGKKHKYPLTLFEALSSDKHNIDDTLAIDNGKKYTRGELLTKAYALAGEIINKVGSNGVIGIRSNRNIDMVIGIFAIVISGNAYLPLGVDYPKDRIEYMLNSAQAKLVISDSSDNMVEGYDGITLNNYSYNAKPYYGTASNGENIAYVLFTSGSTGKPKGVKIKEKSLMNRVGWMNRICPIENGKVMFKTPYTFDVSVWELFRNLVYGGTMIILQDKAHNDMSKIYDTIQAEGVNELHFVPSVYSLFLEYLQDRKVETNLKRIYLSGEALSSELVAKHIGIFGQSVKLYNFYGPTETAVDVTYYLCKGDENNVPIGRVVDNTYMYISDGKGGMAPKNTEGEIIIGGIQVGDGYTNNTEKGFSDGEYHTGDIGYYDENDLFYFVGRNDSQIKYHGQRIELAEIQKALMCIEGVKDAKVVVGGKRQNVLSAFIVSMLSENQIKEKASKFLPQYMIPQIIKILDNIPLNENGKTDIKLLKKDIEKIDIQNDNRTIDNVIECFQKILEIDNITENDDFFALGGDSIKAVRLTARLKKHNVYASIKDLYLLRTPKMIANKYFEQSKNEKTVIIKSHKSAGLSELEKADIYNKYGKDNIIYICRLSPLQDGMAFYSLEEGNRLNYVSQRVINLGITNKEILSKSIAVLFKQFEILSAKVIVKESGNYLVCLNNVTPEIAFIKNEDFETFRQNDFERGFDISKDCLIRFAVCDNGDIVITSHHIILDGWSVVSIWKEWKDIVNSLKNGKKLEEIMAKAKEKANKIPSYADYIKFIYEVDRTEIEQHFDEVFKGFQGRTDYLAKGIKREEPFDIAKEVRVSLPDDLVQATKSFVIKNGISIASLFETVWGIILAKTNLTTDVVFGNVFAGRSLEFEGIEDMIGLFLNTIPIRVKFDEKTTISELLKDVMEQNIYSSYNSHYPLNKQKLKFGTITVFDNFGTNNDDYKKCCKNQFEQTNYDMEFEVEDESSLTYVLRYNYNVYEEREIKNINRYIERLFMFITSGKDLVVNDIPLLSEREVYYFAELIRSYNDKFATTQDTKKIFEAPSGEKEEIVSKAFNDILAIKDRVSANDDFFEMGGDSIKAIRLSVKMKEYGYMISIKKVMEAKTVSNIADNLKKIDKVVFSVESHKEKLSKQCITPADYGAKQMRESELVKVLDRYGKNNVQRIYPLTPLQDGMLFHSLNSQSSFPEYVTQYVVDLPNYSEVTIRKALDILAKRYDILRTAVTIEESGNYQILLANRSPELIYRFDTAIEDAIKEDLNRGFDLQSDSLFRITIVGNKVIETAHHIILDGWSENILWNELKRYLDRIEGGEDYEKVLKELEQIALISPLFEEYVAFLSEKDKEVSKRYYQSIVEGYNGITVYPSQKSDYNAEYAKADRLNVVFDKDLSDSIKRFSAANNLTISAIIETIWGIVLSKVNFTNDVLFGNVISGRDETMDGIGEMVGLFINTVPIRIRIDKSTDYKSLLANVKEQNIAGIEYGYLPLTDQRVSIGTITVSEYFGGKDKENNPFKVRERIDQSNYDLELELSDWDEYGRTGYVLIYNPNVYSVDEMQKLSGYIQKTLEDIIANINNKVENLDIFEENDKEIFVGIKSRYQQNTQEYEDLPFKKIENNKEKAVANAFTEILAINSELSSNSDFFELGGDSIKAIKLSIKLKDLGYGISVKEIMLSRRLNVIAEKLTEYENKKVDKQYGEYPLSAIQQELFYENYVHPEKIIQNLMLDVSDYDKDLIKQALTKVYQRHDMLRATYFNGKMLVQSNEDSEPLYIGDYIVGTMQSEEEILSDIRNKISLDDGCLLASGIIQNGKRTELFIVAHHFIIDIVSWNILLNDLQNAYKGLKSNKDIDFLPQCSSYMEWSKAFDELKLSEQEQKYWKNIVDRAKNINSNFVPAKQKVSKKLIKEYPFDTLLYRNLGISTQEVLLSLLAYSTGDIFGNGREVAITTENHGRFSFDENIDVSTTIGWINAVYPVLLNSSLDYKKGLLYNKESYRCIPHNGIGYRKMKLGYRPQIVFNFAGENKTSSYYGFELLMSSFDTEIEKENLDFEAKIEGNKLFVEYYFNDVTDNDIDAIIDKFNEGLNVFTKVCKDIQKPIKTPSDYEMFDMPFDDLQDIIQKVGDIKDVAPLTPLQSGMLYHSLSHPERKEYIEQETFRLCKKVDKQKLDNTFDVMSKRHSMLISRCVACDSGNIYLVVPEDAVVPIQICKEDYTKKIKEEEIKGINPTKDGLFRVTIIDEGESFVLILTSHHIAYDAWCNQELMQTFYSLYCEIATKDEILEQAQKSTSFYQFARKLHYMDNKDNNVYFANLIKGATKSEIIENCRNTPIGEVEEQKVVIGDYNKIKDYALKRNITPNVVFESGWAFLLKNYCKTNDITFGKVVSGRNIDGIDGIENTVGLFINTLPVRSIATSIKDTVTELNNLSIQYFGKENCSLSGIYQKSEIKEDIIGTLFVYNPFKVTAVDNNDDITLLQSRDSTNYGLTAVVAEEDNVFRLYLMYDKGLYSLDFIKTIINEYNTIVNNLIQEKESIDCNKTSSIKETQIHKQNNNMPNDDTDFVIWDIIKGISDTDIGFNSNFVDSGITSLDRIKIAIRLPKYLGVTMGDVAIADSASELSLIAKKKLTKTNFIPLSVSGNDKVIVMFPYAGATGRIFDNVARKLIGYDVYALKNSVYALEQENEILDEYRQIMAKYNKKYIYAHCLGCFTALEVLKRTESEISIDKAIFGAHIPERFSSFFGLAIDGWKRTSDKAIINTLQDAGLKIGEERTIIAKQFRMDTSLSSIIEANLKFVSKTPAVVLLANNDKFTKDIKKAESRWKKYVSAELTINNIGSGGHYFIGDTDLMVELLTNELEKKH